MIRARAPTILTRTLHSAMQDALWTMQMALGALRAMVLALEAR
jgi:hypothetical protein